MSEPVEVTDDPVPEAVIAYCKTVTTSQRQFNTEIKAYKAFVERYRKQRDKKKRLVMSNLLQYLLFSTEHGMKPSYALTDALTSALGDEKDAQKAMYPLPLHQGLAEIFTSSTHTKGRGRTTNWQMHSGASYSNFNGEGRNWFGDWNAQEILGSYVKFGSHRFTIGNATQRVLGLLEQRYGISFDELEKDLKRKKAEKEA
ncbi:Hypothetical protein NGAL_HAMBI2605_62760 [Neorhizobium galegae bv. orientalis]|nr:Hypothetical protein NGAL_HAMBI2605_62760 [Neorhizobium galegae bv. orientalis]